MILYRNHGLVPESRFRASPEREREAAAGAPSAGSGGSGSGASSLLQGRIFVEDVHAPLGCANTSLAVTSGVRQEPRSGWHSSFQ